MLSRYIVVLFLLSVLLITAVSSGCARRSILFESKRDRMACEQFGGRVSVSVRAEPAVPDAPLVRREMPPASGGSAAGGFEPMPTFHRLPPANRCLGPPGPSLFAPPRLEGVQGNAGFEPCVAVDNAIAASYPATLPIDPAYPEAPLGESLTTQSPTFAPVFEGSGRLEDGVCATAEPCLCLGDRWCAAKNSVCLDYRNYYSRRSMAGLAYGLVFGAVLANTSLDQDFQDWYQDDVRSEGMDDFSTFWKTFGEGQMFIPAFACLAVAGSLLDEWPVAGLAGDFGWRTTRAYLVGAPPMLFMQYMLGASRPGETSHSSHWAPFQDTNSVSGHAFVGAVPFITAAKMTDNLFLKTGLYACSSFTGLSRINDNCHYLSQAILGWWMAYLACEAIDCTECGLNGLTVMPLASTDGVGFGAVYEY